VRRAVSLAITAATVAFGLMSPAGGAGTGGFHGFTSFDAVAQAQAATGYLFMVGDEEDRLAGARATINGPPAGSLNIAAAVQRGVLAAYTYGSIGKPESGEGGTLPEPPPGEANGLYPAEPRESTWQEPVTASAAGPVVDGRFTARASEDPTGFAEVVLSRLDVPGQLTVAHGVIRSRTAPAPGGVEAESISELFGVVIGPLRVESLTSRAWAFVAAGSDDVRTAVSTVVHGATVDGVPVRITNRGVELADGTMGESEKAELAGRVRDALAGASVNDVRLVDTSSVSKDPSSARADAGALRIVGRDDALGYANPQGLSGGGFEVGGASVSIVTRRR